MLCCADLFFMKGWMDGWVGAWVESARIGCIHGGKHRVRYK